MIIELIICVLSFLALLLISTCSNLVLFSLCIFSVFCFGYYYSHTADQRVIRYVLMKIWTGLKFCYKFCRRIYRFSRQLFSSSNFSIPNSSKPVVQVCGDTLTLESEINTLAQNISKFYICSWYDKISDNDEFKTVLNSSIQEALLGLCYSVSQVEKRKFTYTILQLYLHFFSHFIEAMKSSENLDWGNFQFKHWALKDSSTEWCYLQSLVSALLDKYGPTKMENSLRSKSNSLLHTMVVEILTETLIQPLVRVLCHPPRINYLILKILLANSNKILTSVETSVESMKMQPTIVLSNENLSSDSASESNMTLSSENRLFLSSMCSTNQVCADNYNHQPNDIGSDDFSLLLSTGIKSSSNSYLSELDFSDLREPEMSENLPISCDTSIIKRSKSADYIRQMPQLRALNEKDYNIKLQKGNNMMLVALKSENNSNCSVEQAEEAVEIPSLFTNVKITDTFQQVEGFNPYTLYCIQYSALFHDTGTSSDIPHFVTHEVCIKRRFREFLALHSRLEDNPVLKNYVKGIKGPSKWLTLPFSNLDKKNIVERKVFLEGYLKELCSLAPIAQSSELQEFLAYGGDARISFAKKAGDINVPRIDKFLVRGVKGAIDMFKTALPNSTLEVEGILPIKASLDEATPDQRFQEHLLDFSSREPEIKEHIKNYIQNSMGNPSFFNACEEWKCSETKCKRPSLLRNLPNFRAEQCCACPEIHDTYDLVENPFGNTMIELIDLAIDFNSLKFGGFLKTFLSSFAASINSFVENKVDSISEDHLASSLHFLHEYLWPSEMNRNEINMPQDSFSNLDKIVEHLDGLLSSSFLLDNNIYSAKDALLDKIRLFLLSLQNENANKCLLFHMFDVVIEYMCRKED